MNVKRKQACNGPTLRGDATGGTIPRGGCTRIGPGRGRRRGSVLLMVVALLSILFVVGAAFLSSVAFESRSITAAQKVQARTSVIDTLLGEVQVELAKGFVGNDGLPLNQDTPSTIGNDTYGEVPGIHPLIASIDPYDDGSNWVFYGSTDLERSLEGKTVALDATYFPRVAVNTILEDRVDPEPDEFAERGSVYDPDDDNDPADSKYYRRDADGDGVWDSNEYELLLSRFPAAMRGALSSQLRADDADLDPNADADALYYALRVVPHGGMVNLNHSHAKLLETLFDGLPGWDLLTGDYLPAGEESTLRRRFLLPPRDIPLSGLQERESDIAEALYALFVSNFNAFQLGDQDAEWWPLETGINGDDVSAMDDPTTGWLSWMNPSIPVTYDIRHLLTTVSYDDQLMRLGRSTQPGLAHQDWIEDILSDDNPTVTDVILPGNFWIQDWPNSNTGNPVRGRLKVSLPGLIQQILIPNDPDGTFFGVGGTYDGHEIDSLTASAPPLDPLVREQFVRTTQDAFMLMLRNVDTAVLALPDRQRTAASLTANLIDFADSDTNELPTWVEVADANGVVTGEIAYGLERQPFITEVYADGSTSGFSFAIELYNPYDSPLALSNALSNYELVDNAAGSHQLSGLGVTRINSPMSLAGITIPVKSFVTIYAGSWNVPAPAPADGGVPSGGTWGVDLQSVIQLRRTVPGPGGNVTVVVDEFDAGAVGAINLGILTQNVSVERDTSEKSAGVSNWRFVVPLATETPSHTLGALNSLASQNPSIHPVQLDFANTGDIATAFPTTGTLLLLSRYAHMDDGAGGLTPFNADLATNPALIDNGRMPIFDQTQLADSNPGPFSLGLPWGQLVFDYFTALPLSNKYDPAMIFDGGNPATFMPSLMPTVDQTGLRVHGRIDINSAPWAVLAGLPRVPADAIPSPFRAKIKTKLGLLDTVHTEIGSELAQSIVAYREARQLPGTGDFSAGVSGIGDRLRDDGFGIAYTGFLTVGELANVRNGAGGAAFNIDYDVIGSANEDYVEAVAVLVALGDWVTTRSHVFTVYGTLRGAGSKSGSDQKAIRFQETLDRLPSMFGNSLPKRIGQRTVSSYTDARGD